MTQLAAWKSAIERVLNGKPPVIMILHAHAAWNIC